MSDESYRRQVARLFERSAFYREKLARAGFVSPRDAGGLADIARLPFTEKDELRQSQAARPPLGAHAAVGIGELARIYSTSGTSGTPLYIPLTRADVEEWRDIGRRTYGRNGIRPTDGVITTFGAGPFVAGASLAAFEAIGCTHIPTGVGNTDTQVTVARAVGATGYVGTPSFLMTVLQRAGELGVRLGLEVAQVGAEPFPESLRDRFEREFGIMARQGFGTADLGMLAYECPEKAGMHLVDDAITQICDPQTGEPLGYGRIGEIVATVNNATYPMIRFATGDLSVVTDDPCPCGRTAPRMLGWRGRADEVTKVRGMFIHPRQADEVVARVAGIERYQVVVGREGHSDTLTLRVQPSPGTDGAALRAPLEAAIRDVMKLRGVVDVVAAGTIPDGARKIADERTWD